MNDVAERGLRALEAAVQRRGGRLEHHEQGGRNTVRIYLPGGRPIAAVVKSRSAGDWQASKSDGDSNAEPDGSLWILVDLTARPAEFMIVPTHEIKWMIAENAIDWATRNGGPIDQGHTKITTESVVQWRNRWDLIGQDDGSKLAGAPLVERAHRHASSLSSSNKLVLLLRCVLEVSDPTELIATVDHRLDVWVAELGLVLCGPLNGAPTELGRGYSGTRQERNDADGARYVRTVLTTNTKTWVVTVDNPDGAGPSGFVVVDLCGPADQEPVGLPSLIPSLLGAAVVVDAGWPVRPTATMVGAEGLEGLVAMVTDPARRGLVQVSAAPHDVSVITWCALVQDVVANTFGLTQTVVLNPETARAFANEIGADHQVPPGCIRCYEPGAVTGDPGDARRHPYVSRDRIENDPIGVRRDLARHARVRALQAPLPPRLVDVDLMFAN